MSIIQSIFDAFGGATKLAAATGDPVQTVHSWKVNGNIPRWRKASVAEAATRLSLDLPPAIIEYLTSDAKGETPAPEECVTPPFPATKAAA